MSELAYQRCIDPDCETSVALDDTSFQCPKCGSLMDVAYDWNRLPVPKSLREFESKWSRRAEPLEFSGVWRFRELFPFANDNSIPTIGEGQTLTQRSDAVAAYAGMSPGRLFLQYEGMNPSGSFKDNGMTAAFAHARMAGARRAACASTGNTSASLAIYCAATDLMRAVIFIGSGKISYGKLAQALEYGARTLQVDANFDQILKLVRVLAEKLGIYLLNSINPFRIEGQKTIIVEMLDQRDWSVPDWIVVPGGNLGNVSAFGKALMELRSLGFIDKTPKLAVIQAEGSAPFAEFMKAPDAAHFPTVEHPETLATAIKIGDPVSWPKAWQAVEWSGGLVEKVTEQEIADAKAQIGLCGIGCEPASAATLAGIRKLIADGRMKATDDVMAILTGNVLKDPDYIFKYHTGQLKDPHGAAIASTFGNRPTVVPNDPDKIAALLDG